MKHFLVTVVAIIVTTLGLCAQSYSIYQVTGSVEIKPHNSESWNLAKKRDILSSYDMMKIPNGATVSLVNEETNIIIKDIKPGEYIIRDIAEASKKHSESLLKTLNKKLIKEIKKESEKNNHYLTYGATTRGLHDEPTYCDSLYAAIYDYFKGDRKITNTDLELKEVPSEDGTFHFVISNNTDKTYFVNVLKEEEGKLSYCYDFNFDGFDVLPLPAGHTADLAAWKFITETTDVKYHIIGTKRPYNTSVLKYDLYNLFKPIVQGLSTYLITGI